MTPMYDLIVEQLTEHLGVDPTAISPESTLKELELDSLSLAELVVILEEKLDTSLLTGIEQDIDPDMTLGRISELLEQVVASPPSAQQ